MLFFKCHKKNPYIPPMVCLLEHTKLDMKPSFPFVMAQISAYSNRKIVLRALRNFLQSDVASRELDLSHGEKLASCHGNYFFPVTKPELI